MCNRSQVARCSLLALTIAIAACGAPGSIGAPVAIKTGSLGGGCYTSGVTGDLVADPAAGTAIVDEMGGRLVVVTWPIGWNGRRSGSEVEVLDESGTVEARTGTHVSLMGGYWTDGTFLTCGPAR
jgi:hypothetical protein